MENMKKIACIFVVCLAVLTGCSGSGGTQKALDEYLEAVKKGDFETMYHLNARMQKKIALIYRGSEERREESLKRNYEKYKAEYDQLEASMDLSGLWSEKFIITADSNYTITTVEVVEESGTPASKFKYNKLGQAEVSVDYNNKETAPSHGGDKVKQLVCHASLIKGEDVVKGIKTKQKFPKWVVKDLYIKSGSVTYWKD